MKCLNKTRVFLFFFLGFCLSGFSQKEYTEKLTDQDIIKIIENCRPSIYEKIHCNIRNRLGVTHMDGQYYFTNEPFIIEGSKKIQELGYSILKLWFKKYDGNAYGYEYNSDWQLSKLMSLKELAQHKYYKAVFELPFKVFVLNINEGYVCSSREEQILNLNQIKNEMYELTKYLLDKYKDREVTFILSMWEGDWTMRGGTNPSAKWKENGVPSDARIRVENMIDWVNARQSAVDSARYEIRDSKCKVYHAIEVNKVYDGMEGIPTLTTSVLPNVRVDMVSWSAYDGKSKDGIKMYRGIDFIKQNLHPSDYMEGKKVVFIGEIGEPENINNQTRESIHQFWDTMMGVYLAQDIPYIVIWELYCNEPKYGPRSQDKKKGADELRGFWLIRPDGSKGWAQEYFEEILARSNQ